MGPLRTLLHSHRALAIWLFALALAMKALVPAGYMVGAQNQSIVIRICDGLDHGLVRTLELGRNAVDQIAQGKADHGQTDRGKPDGVCPYTALGHASLDGVDPVLLAAALAFNLTLAFAPLVPVRRRRIAHAHPPLRGPPGVALLA